MRVRTSRTAAAAIALGIAGAALSGCAHSPAAVGDSAPVADRTVVWTRRETASMLRVFCLNGSFFGVSDLGRIYSSEDAITWSVVASGLPQVHHMAYGDGVYAAVGAESLIITSRDGAEWTVRNHRPGGPYLFGVRYNGSVWLAVGGRPFSAPSIYRSRDGVTWSDSTPVATGLAGTVLNAVEFFDGKWVVGGDSLGSPDHNARIAWSSDGVTWKSAAVPGGYFTSISCLAGGTVEGRPLIVAGASWYKNAETLILYSPDGVNWERATSGISKSVGEEGMQQAVWTGDGFLMAGDVPAGEADGYLLASGDGIHWRELPAPPGRTNGVAFSAATNKLLVCGPAGKTSVAVGIQTSPYGDDPRGAR
jgi:hypothetical protein